MRSPSFPFSSPKAAAQILIKAIEGVATDPPRDLTGVMAIPLDTVEDQARAMAQVYQDEVDNLKGQLEAATDALLDATQEIQDLHEELEQRQEDDGGDSERVHELEVALKEVRTMAHRALRSGRPARREAPARRRTR